MKKGFELVGTNLLAIGIYFILAMFAKAGFSWQSSAITLWPASGFANAIAITSSWAILPGLAIGNFIGTACDPNTGCSIQPFMVPVAIAAAAQAALVRYALVKQNLLNDPLTRISRLLAFLIWIGPLGNWPASLTFFLYQLAHQTPELPLYQIFNGTLFWWLGDSLGSLLLLPFLFLYLPFKNPLWKERKPYLIVPLIALITALISAVLIEKNLLERINPTLNALEPLQALRLLGSLAWTVLTFGVLGLILQVAGKSVEQKKLFIRSRLVADAAGAVIHEIGQPLIRLRLRLERIVNSYTKTFNQGEKHASSSLEVEKEVLLSLQELDSIVINTRSIQDLTIAGIRDSDGADLSTAISRVTTQIRPELNRLDQDLTIQLKDPLPKVSAGQIQLQAAIRNLLINASNAAGENGVIRVNVRALDNYSIYIEIEDSGCGFNPNYIPTGESRSHSSTGGMGLGLMIVRRVVDDNGGKISFGDSNELGGAKVKILLNILPKTKRIK